MPKFSLFDYLKEHEWYLKNAYEKGEEPESSLDYDPALIAKLISGILIQIEQVDSALLKATCADFVDEVGKFLKSGIKDDRIETFATSNVFQHLQLNLASRETEFVVPYGKSRVGDTLYRTEKATLTAQQFLNFSDAIPNLKRPGKVYSLPDACNVKVIKGLDYFHPIFSDAIYADEDKVIAALVNGFDVENAGSGYLTSPETIVAHGLHNNVALAMYYSASSIKDYYPLEGSPLTLRNSFPLLLNDNKHLQSSYALQFFGPLQSKDIAVREIKLQKSFDSYLPKTVKKTIKDISQSATLDDAVELAIKRLEKLANLRTRDSLRASESPFADSMTYAFSVPLVIEAVVKRFDVELAHKLSTPNAKTEDYFDIIFTLKGVLENINIKLPRISNDLNAVRAALMGLESSSFEHISESVFRILNDEGMSLRRRTNLPVNLVSQFMPDNFKTHLLKKGLAADFALLCIGQKASTPIKQCEDLTKAADGVIDYLLEIERQHPGLILRDDGISYDKCKDLGVSFVNIDCRDEFAIDHFCSHGPFGNNESLANWFRSRLMVRLTNEITLSSLNESDNEFEQRGKADVSFLTPSSI